MAAFSIEEIKNCSVVPKAYLFSTALQVTTAMIQSVVVLPSSLVTVNSFILSTNASPALILYLPGIPTYRELTALFVPIVTEPSVSVFRISLAIA